MGPKKIREPIVEGIFYPSEAAKLQEEVDGLLADARNNPQKSNRARAIIAPHAGYQYCGKYSASAFIAAEGRDIDTVVIIAPVHREPEDSIFLTESAFFATPLGKTAVLQELNSELEECSTRIFRNDLPHLEEHAIEVQLPFIQTLFPKAGVIPILMGRATATNVRLLSRALEATFAEKYDSTLFVVSSNLSSHTEDAEAADSMRRLISLIERHDCEEILSAYHKKDITACGAGCIATLCCLSMPPVSIELLLKTDLHSKTDDTGQIIHYGALAFFPVDG
ncbi:MAG: AmmeMemoRadiSam system protein B [Spirochaetales bacterium]|nr:AmmeMemoRadiSam system protein B [Spirochaetales bacterium]